MKIMQLWRLVALLLWLVLIGSGCTSRKSEATSIDAINQEIADSFRTHNLDFVKQAISQGKREARDSDAYYNFVVQDIIRYFYTAQLDSVLLSADSVIHYLSGKPYSKLRNDLMIKCMQAKGLYYTQYAFHADSMLFYQKEACRYAERGGDENDRLLSYANLADAYKFGGDLSMSAMTYRQAIALADSIQADTASYIPLYSGLAATYTTLRDFGQSKIWWDKCDRLWNLMTVYDRFNYLNSRGNDYFYQKDYRRALETFLRLDTFLLAYPDMEWEIHFCKANLSDIYLKLHQPEQARPLIAENLAYFGASGYNEMVMSHLHTQQMELALQDGDFGQAEALAARYPYRDDMRSEQGLLRLDFLRRFAGAKHDWKKAFEYEKAYTSLSDSLRSERVRMKIAETRMRYERDATILNQNLVISDKEAELMRIYALLAGVTAIVLVLILFNVYRRKRVKQREEQMLRRIVTMKMENARNRITPHFIYNALNHELLARQEGRPSSLGVLVDMLRQGQSLASVFCTTLREELNFIDLYVAVEGESLGEKFEYRVSVAEGIDLNAVRLPSMMVQIFVENAIKHGLKKKPLDAEKRLTVQVNHRDGAIYIEVLNNGPLPVVQRGGDKSQVGLRVVAQIIQLLNARNKQPMRFELGGYRTPEGEEGCRALLVIPDVYNFDIND
ncbi:histidine kinase [Barnesiella viscericola]|uniref:Histidine kinase n=1 Tax=Barnesiella viscericola TaxID=397865 RepID=A0A921SU91_9BACT|nr:histidine kinase [Barnesiella viscericola]HJG88014.1 histidine kinase [Barnesiella viscericola]